MKIFVYKTIFLCVAIIVLYHSTIGYSVRYIKFDIINYFNKDKIVFFIKDKIRNEIKSSLNKKNILQPDDAKLIGDFINKINKEIKKN